MFARIMSLNIQQTRTIVQELVQHSEPASSKTTALSPSPEPSSPSLHDKCSMSGAVINDDQQQVKRTIYM